MMKKEKSSMAEYVAGRGTTALGIIGTVLGGIGASGANLLGGMGGNVCCAENMPVNRYELNQEKEMAHKDAEIAYLRGQNETNEKLTAVYANLEGQINALSAKVQANKDEQNGVNLQQAVYNGTNNAAVACMQGQIATLMGLTKLVVPNTSVCPGWGEVTVAPAAATTT
jgi:hypothetical protein